MRYRFHGVSIGGVRMGRYQHGYLHETAKAEEGMKHGGTYRPGEQWIPWVHGFSDPDDLIGDDLPQATRYLSIFGWEREFVRHDSEGMKVWFHHARTRTSILFPYAYWREPNTLLIPETIVRP